MVTVRLVDRAHWIRNSRRILVMTLSIALLTIAPLSLIFSLGDPVGRLIAAVASLVGIAGAGRALLLGVRVTEQGMVVRTWFRTWKLGYEEVLDARTIVRSEGVYPAVVLVDGRLVPLVMMEKGIIHEMHSPEQQWGGYLVELNDLLARRRLKRA